MRVILPYHDSIPSSSRTIVKRCLIRQPLALPCLYLSTHGPLRPATSRAMAAALVKHSPFPYQHNVNSPYIAWHVRTSHGETAMSYDPIKHPYVLQDPPEVVCPAFADATAVIQQACEGADVVTNNATVYMSSNRCVLCVLMPPAR